MVFCIVALIVFGIMGIFSATHRTLAKEALDCVLKTIVLKPCDTGFDDKMKAKITGKIAKTSPKTAKAIYKHFQLFSWLMVIITIGSLIFSIQAVYNLAIYNNCNGPNPDDYCIITNLAIGSQVTADDCQCDFDTSNCSSQAISNCNFDCNCLEGVCGPDA